jgi:hypothetical protein
MPLAAGDRAPDSVILGAAGAALVWRMHPQLDRDKLDRTLTPVQRHAE